MSVPRARFAQRGGGCVGARAACRGASAGICLAMLYRQEPMERAHVHLEDGLPLLEAGAAVGCLVGACVFAACARWPRPQAAATVLVAAALGAAIAAPLGWVIFDLG